MRPPSLAQLILSWFDTIDEYAAANITVHSLIEHCKAVGQESALRLVVDIPSVFD